MNYKLIYKCIVGSRAYGTNVEGSDVDIKGVYIQDPEEILTFGYRPQFEIGKDEVYYEVRRFIELAGSANPTILEMLFSPEDCILGETVEWQYIKDFRFEFLTKECRLSFGGYAHQQIKKAKGLNKKMNWDKEHMVRKTPMDFCYIYDEWTGGSVLLQDYLDTIGMDQQYCGLTNTPHMRDCYTLYFDWDANYNDCYAVGLKGICGEDSNSLRLSSIPTRFEAIGLVYYNKNGYEQHCRAYKEYTTWQKEKNVQRYVDIENHGQQIDGKNMLHCMRLIQTAKEIAIEGVLKVRRDNAQELIDIRLGKVDLETLLTKAEFILKELDVLYVTSALPAAMSNTVQQEILLGVRRFGYDNTKKHGEEGEDNSNP